MGAIYTGSVFFGGKQFDINYAVSLLSYTDPKTKLVGYYYYQFDGKIWDPFATNSNYIKLKEFVGTVNIWLSNGYGIWRLPDTLIGILQDPKMPHKVLLGSINPSFSAEDNALKIQYVSLPLCKTVFNPSFYIVFSKWNIQCPMVDSQAVPSTGTLPLVGGCDKYPWSPGPTAAGAPDPSKPPVKPPGKPPRKIRKPMKVQPKAAVLGPYRITASARGFPVSLQLALTQGPVPGDQRTFSSIAGTVDFMFGTRKLGTATPRAQGNGLFTFNLDTIIDLPRHTVCLIACNYSGEVDGAPGVDPNWDVLLENVFTGATAFTS